VAWHDAAMSMHRAIVVALTLSALLAACASRTTAPSAAPDPLAGTYVVKGGGAPLDVFTALSDEFRKQHPTVRFTFSDVGSAAGMRLAATGEVDLATSSAPPPPELRDKVGLVPVGVSGTGVIVNAANPVTTLTRTQVRDIFSGAVADWSDVGGNREKIIVVIRESTSALRSNFDAYFFDGKPAYPSTAVELNSGTDIVAAVSARTGVISMVTLTEKIRSDQHVRFLSLDGVAPTKKNVQSGAYPVLRPLYLVRNAQQVTPAIAAFLDFVRGSEGQRIIESITSPQQ
jgi:phosphate transport system substrate-binding protein